jgi:alanine racemase
VGCDNHQGGFLAGEHLIKQGRTKIAFLGDASRHFPEFRERYLGCADALASYDLSLNPHLQEDAENLEESGYQACQQLLQSGQDFDALLAASDLIAIGAIKALQEAGIEVPGQVAVVGFDDIPSSAYVNPPLTTVLQDTSAAGELLVDNLLAQIRGESTGTQLLEPRLVVRQSCGCQATQPEG